MKRHNFLDLKVVENDDYVRISPGSCGKFKHANKEYCYIKIL